MLLYQYIYQLIIENDCVVIPNFGAFIANYSQANVDFSNKEFIPPKREIIFNENLKHNDLLLADYIANKKNISLENASSLVQTFVEETQKLLEKGDTIKIHKLGNIKLQKGKIEFIANQKENFYEDSYGLSNFVFPFLANQIVVPQLEQTQAKKHKRKFAWIFVPAAAAATVAGLLFFSYHTNFLNINSNLNLSNLIPSEIFKQNTKPAETTKIPNPEINTTAEEIKTDSLSIQQEEVNSEITKENVKEDINTPKVMAYAIVGGFANYNNAQRLNEDLISKGYSSEILPFAKGLYKVSIKSYQTRQDAINDLDVLKIQSKNSDIWILYTE